MSLKCEKKTEQLLEFITHFIQKNNYPPSVREMQKGIGVASTATINYYLEKLQKLNLIKKSAMKNRTIELVRTEEQPESVSVPFVGQVAAGVPILAEEHIEEYIPLPKNMFHKDEMFLLNVVGESMINAGILPNDKVIVQKTSSAKNGDIVVALIDQSATVKRFFKEKDHIRLQPENDFMEPILVKNVDILGIVIGLLRQY